MNELQLSMLLSNQLLLLKTGMELTRNAKQFRTYFKKQMGLKPNASHKEVIFYIGFVYKDNGIFDKFKDTLARHKMSHLLDEVQYA
jgi:hypothetical protein